MARQTPHEQGGERAVHGPVDVAVLVGEALGLHVPRLVEVLLDEALAPTERRDRFTRRRLELRGDLLARELAALESRKARAPRIFGPG